MAHTVADCPQNPTLDHIMKSLDRFATQGERTATALEEIAAQSVAVANHEKRLDKHDLDFRELFSRVNDEKRLASVEERVADLEMKHAKEAGAVEVETEQKKFWAGVKTQMAPYLPFAIFLALYVLDQHGLVLKVLELWNKFNG